MQRTHLHRTSALLGSLALIGAMIFALTLNLASGKATQRASSAPLVINEGFTNADEPGSLDPAVDYDNGGYDILSQMYDGLVRAVGSTTSRILPDLATSWSSSPNGLTWTFHLRPNVKFHDGTAVTAKAVQFTFNRLAKLKQGSFGDFTEIASVAAPNPLTVVFHLKYRFTSFLLSLTTPYGADIVSPTALLAHQVKHDLGTKWLSTHDAGSGPYELKSWTHGQQILLKRFPGYWAGWSGNHTNEVVFQFAASSATVRLGLQNGSVDAAIGLSNQDLAAFGQGSNVKVANYPSIFVQVVSFNTTQGPLKNRLVRLALAYSFDTAQFVKHVWGPGSMIARSYVPAGIPGYVALPHPYTFDLAKTHQLLQQAGYAKGLNLQAEVLTGDTQGALCLQIWKADLAKIGVNITIKVMPVSEFFALVSKATTAPAISQNVGWGLDYPDDSFTYNAWLNPHNFGTSGNYAYYNNPKVTALLLKARAAPTYAAGLAIYRRMLAITFNDAPYVPLVQLPAHIALSAHVHGYEYNIAYTPLYFNVYHMWKS